MADLHRISVSSFHEGFVLPSDVLNDEGTVVLPAGTMLNKLHVTALSATPSEIGIWGHADWPESMFEPEPAAATDTSGDAAIGVIGNYGSSGGRGANDPAVQLAEHGTTIDTRTLRVGSRLACDLYDTSGVLLLAAGAAVTSRFLYHLRQRAITVVRLEPAGHGASVDGSEIPGSKTGTLELSDLFVEARRGIETHAEASGLLAEMAQGPTGSGSMSSDRMRSLVGTFVNQLTLDRDLLLTIIGMKHTENEYLFGHGVNVALLSMAIGEQLGLSEEQLLELGLGAVFQDCGMLNIPSEIRLSPGKLSPHEFRAIEEHPAHTLRFIDRIRGLPTVARYIGYQVHERADGSGYPRGRTSSTTHPYSSIVGLADMFCAMTRPRPYRHPVMPHQTIKAILYDGRDNKFDNRLLRAFLDRVSAFPIGSIVELSDGSRTRVIRANEGQHTRPVVVELNSADEPVSGPVDLLAQTDLKVVRELSFVHGSLA